MTGVGKARRIRMLRAKKIRMAKGLGVSIAVHVLFCGLLGFAAVHLPPMEPMDGVYDVALVGGGTSSAPAAPKPSAPPAVPEPQKAPVETPPPQPDDIVEEQPKETQTFEPPAESAPQPTTEPASAVSGGSSEAGTGDGAGSGAAEGNPGGGEGQGIPPVSDAIEAPAVPPSVMASRAPEYPYSAQRRGIEGTVVVRFLLNKEGDVDDVEIAESSGSDSLDRAALEAAEGFSFSPGLDGYGRPVRCYAYQPFTFMLE